VLIRKQNCFTHLRNCADQKPITSQSDLCLLGLYFRFMIVKLPHNRPASIYMHGNAAFRWIVTVNHV